MLASTEQQVLTSRTLNAQAKTASTRAILSPNSALFYLESVRQQLLLTKVG